MKFSTICFVILSIIYGVIFIDACIYFWPCDIMNPPYCPVDDYFESRIIGVIHVLWILFVSFWKLLLIYIVSTPVFLFTCVFLCVFSLLYRCVTWDWSSWKE